MQTRGAISMSDVICIIIKTRGMLVWETGVFVCVDGGCAHSPVECCSFSGGRGSGRPLFLSQSAHSSGYKQKCWKGENYGEIQLELWRWRSRVLLGSRDRCGGGFRGSSPCLGWRARPCPRGAAGIASLRAPTRETDPSRPPPGDL